MVRHFPIASEEPAPHESSFLVRRYTSSVPGRPPPSSVDYGVPPDQDDPVAPHFI